MAFVNKRIFISYSHNDRWQVEEIVRLLSVTDASIFRDYTKIDPGKKWRPLIEKAINDAEVMLVFWSANSKDSAEVKVEYEAARALNKDIVPVILDQTPLIPVLSEYQGINFAALFRSRGPGANAGASSGAWFEARCILLHRIFNGSVATIDDILSEEQLAK
jgi:hypothetical protein